MIVSMISLGNSSKPFSGDAGVADSDNWVTSVMAKLMQEFFARGVFLRFNFAFSDVKEFFSIGKSGKELLLNRSSAVMRQSRFSHRAAPSHV